jgi:hypothetical protein
MEVVFGVLTLMRAILTSQSRSTRQIPIQILVQLGYATLRSGKTSYSRFYPGQYISNGMILEGKLLMLQ